MALHGAYRDSRRDAHQVHAACNGLGCCEQRWPYHAAQLLHVGLQSQCRRLQRVVRHGIQVLVQGGVRA